MSKYLEGEMRMGLGLGKKRHHLWWVWRGGWGRTWCPQWFLHAVVKVWNPVACKIWGHDWYPVFDGVRIDDEGRLLDEITQDHCGACCALRPHAPYKEESNAASEE